MIRYEQIKKKTIICDVDGCLGKFVEKFNSEMKRLGYEINDNKLTSWSLNDRFYPIKGKNIEKDYLKILNNSNFWANLSVFENAQEILKKLNKKYILLIVTSPFPQVVNAFKKGRLEWMENNFPFIARNQIKFESEKWKIPADIIIEDKPETIEKFDGERIVMNADYNKEIDVKHKRVSSWREIEELLL